MSEGFTNGWALVIGVSRYRHYSDLPAVSHDAVDVLSLLRDPLRAGYPRHQVRSLIDEEATRSAVLAELRRLADEAGPQDTVVIYFSGHGGRPSAEPDAPGYLLAFDADPNDLPCTAIAAEELTAAFRAITAARLVVAIDACHAGATGDPKGGDGASPPMPGLTKEGLAGLATGAGRVVIASSRTDEFSWIESGARNSLFTGHLLSAFRGGLRSADGYVRILDLFTYVAARVAEARPDQHPFLKAAMEDNFPVALSAGVYTTVETPTPAPAKSMPEPSGEPGLSDAWWGELLETCASLFPDGPVEDDLWKRAGGDRSRLRIRGSGRSAWRAALEDLRLGGGGTGITPAALLGEMRSERPRNPDLARLEAALGTASG